MTGRGEPKAESGWFWRRLYVYVVTAALCGHVLWLSLKISDAATLRVVIRNDQGLILLFSLLYLAGASTEAIAGLVAAVKSGRDPEAKP